MPAPDDHHSAIESHQADGPLISVIIPEALEDPRRNPEYLEHWTRLQEANEGLFEVIVVLREGDEKTERIFRSHLREHDRLIKGAFANPLACYAAGAIEAKGRFLLLTENHTKALPDCLAEVSRFLRTSSFRAASLRSAFENFDYLDRLEQGLYERYQESKWSVEGEWNRVRLRGFVIERSLFAELGGMPEGLGLFAEEYFSAKLSEAGVPVGYIQDATVTHVNAGSFSLLREDIEDFTVGECHYRDTIYSRALRPYFGEPETWRRRVVHLPGMRESLSDALIQVADAMLRRRKFRFAGKLFLMAVGQRVIAAMGEEWWARRHEWRVQRNRFLALLFQKSERGLRAFEEMWQAVRGATRMKYFAEHPQPEAYELPEGLSFVEADPPQLGGFHERETVNGRELRWTEPVALVRLRLQHGDYRCQIDTAGIRGDTCDFPFGIVVNHHLVGQVEVREGVISFLIPREWMTAQEQLIVLISEPFDAVSGDERLLGLPVLDFRVLPMPVQKN